MEVLHQAFYKTLYCEYRDY